MQCDKCKSEVQKLRRPQDSEQFQCDDCLLNVLFIYPPSQLEMVPFQPVLDLQERIKTIHWVIMDMLSKPKPAWQLPRVVRRTYDHWDVS